MKLVYKYCSVSSAFSILKNSEFWLFNNLSMNDYMDCRWCMYKINQMLETNFTKDYKDGKFDELLKNYNLNDRPVYMTCFSEEGDLLSQWRGYADDGHGVAIGIDIEETGIEIKNDYGELNEFFVTNASPNCKLSMGWAKCSYEENKQEDLLNSIFNNFLNSTIDSNKIVNTSALLFTLNIIFKNSGFKEEKEWRLVDVPLILNENGKILGNPSALFFLNSLDNIKPYFKYSFSKNCIKEIILGPKCKISRNDMNLFLKSNNYNIDFSNIKKSATSYR